jgi:hypothetical protein
MLTYIGAYVFLFGGDQMPPSPWNIGLSYRVPDNNLNVQCNYQQGKGNVQINCVPEEGQHLLGPSGKYDCVRFFLVYYLK